MQKEQGGTYMDRLLANWFKNRVNRFPVRCVTLWRNSRKRAPSAHAQWFHNKAPGPFIWRIPGLFEFHKDGSPLIQEASSVLTDCLGVPAPIKVLLSHRSYFTPFCRRYYAFVNSDTTNKLNVILRKPRASYKTNSIHLSNRTLVPFKWMNESKNA